MLTGEHLGGDRCTGREKACPQSALRQEPCLLGTYTFLTGQSCRKTGHELLVSRLP